MSWTVSNVSFWFAKTYLAWQGNAINLLGKKNKQKNPLPFWYSLWLYHSVWLLDLAVIFISVRHSMWCPAYITSSRHTWSRSECLSFSAVCSMEGAYQRPVSPPVHLWWRGHDAEWTLAGSRNVASNIWAMPKLSLMMEQRNKNVQERKKYDNDYCTKL